MARQVWGRGEAGAGQVVCHSLRLGHSSHAGCWQVLTAHYTGVMPGDPRSSRRAAAHGMAAGATLALGAMAFRPLPFSGQSSQPELHRFRVCK